MSRTKRKLPKKRNPIAKQATKMKTKVVPDKRKAARMKVLDELTAEAQRMGFYDI